MLIHSVLEAAGEAVALPDSALTLLREGIAMLRDGDGVTLMPASAEVSSAEAADVLAVRDEYVRDLIARGELASLERGMLAAGRERAASEGADMEQKHLDQHFDFLTPDDIRIKGHRIGIEHVLYPYVYESCTPERILERFDTLTLEEVLLTIEYYHAHEESVGRYLADGLEWSRERRAEQAADPSLDEWRARMAKAREEFRLLRR